MASIFFMHVVVSFVTNVFGLKNFFQVSVIWFHTLDALPQNGDTWKGSSSCISQGILGNSGCIFLLVDL